MPTLLSVPSRRNSDRRRMVRFMGGVALAIGVASFVGPSVGAETVLVSSEPADGAEIIVWATA